MPKKKKAKPARDVNQNAKRIFDEMIERSEQQPNRGALQRVERPSLKK